MFIQLRPQDASYCASTSVQAGCDLIRFSGHRAVEDVDGKVWPDVETETQQEFFRRVRKTRI